MDQGSTRKRSAVHNFAPTVTKFCVMWEGQALPHDTKFGKSRCEIVGRRVIFIWSLIHGSSWSGLIKVGPGRLIYVCITRPQWVNSTLSVWLDWHGRLWIIIMTIIWTNITQSYLNCKIIAWFPSLHRLRMVCPCIAQNRVRDWACCKHVWEHY